MVVGGQRHASAALPLERPGTHFIGGSLGPRVGLDVSGKNLVPTGIRSPDHPAHSASLYRLSYPGPPGPGIPHKQILIRHWADTCRQKNSK